LAKLELKNKYFIFSSQKKSKKIFESIKETLKRIRSLSEKIFRKEGERILKEKQHIEWL